jgi:hypothetical protein
MPVGPARKIPKNVASAAVRELFASSPARRAARDRRSFCILAPDCLNFERKPPDDPTSDGKADARSFSRQVGDACIW